MIDLVNLKYDMPVVDKYVQGWIDRMEALLDRAEGILTRLRDETEVVVSPRRKGVLRWPQPSNESPHSAA